MGTSHKKPRVRGEKFRSKWVVQGDQQKPNLSLNDPFTLVSCISSLRILLALAILKNLRVFAWDINSTYLHGRIDHGIYVSFLDGYSKLGRVGKLNKVFYSLLEAACIWREDLEEKFKILGFTPLESDTRVYL